MPKSAFDLLVLGELNPDVVVTCEMQDVRFGQVEQLVSNATLTLGSSGAITAAAAAAQGLSVAFCGVVGDDPVGEMTVDMLAGLDVDVSGVARLERRSTGMTVVLSSTSGDRALLTFPGTMGDLKAEDVPARLLERTRHVHTSSFYLQSALQQGIPSLFRSIRARGASTSLDTGWDPKGNWSPVSQVLGTVDYLMPNEQEAIHLSRTLGWIGSVDDVGACSRWLHQHGPTLIVKLGAAGAMAVDDTGTWSLRIPPVAPVDTTGAGDNFNAGFLTAVLEGESLPTALSRAAATGTFSVGGIGGTGRLASHDEVMIAASALQHCISTQNPCGRTAEENPDDNH